VPRSAAGSGQRATGAERSGRAAHAERSGRGSTGIASRGARSALAIRLRKRRRARPAWPDVGQIVARVARPSCTRLTAAGTVQGVTAMARSDLTAFNSILTRPPSQQRGTTPAKIERSYPQARKGLSTGAGKVIHRRGQGFCGGVSGKNKLRPVKTSLKVGLLVGLGLQKQNRKPQPPAHPALLALPCLTSARRKNRAAPKPQPSFTTRPLTRALRSRWPQNPCPRLWITLPAPVDNPFRACG
jgi:hypothetical protein